MNPVLVIGWLVVIGIVFSFIFWWEKKLVGVCDSSFVASNWISFDEAVEICEPEIVEVKRLSAVEEENIKAQKRIIESANIAIEVSKKKQWEYKESADWLRNVIGLSAEMYHEKLAELGFQKPKS